MEASSYHMALHVVTEDSGGSMYARVAESGLEASIVEDPHHLLKDKIPEEVEEACKLVEAFDPFLAEHT